MGPQRSRGSPCRGYPELHGGYAPHGKDLRDKALVHDKEQEHDNQVQGHDMQEQEHGMALALGMQEQEHGMAQAHDMQE